MKVAIVADWLTNRGGAEVVIDQLRALFPDAPIFTPLFRPEAMGDSFRNADVRTAEINKIPFFRNHHSWALPWLPAAIESFNLDEFDLVISSSHSVAKGVITKPETLHLCYCHTPMRYAWDLFHTYLREAPHPWPIPLFIPSQMHRIRQWDFVSASRVDAFVANSSFSAKRIEKFYRRNSTILPPPVLDDRFYPVENRKPEGYFLAMGRLVRAKRFDLLIAAANERGFRLQIAGRGPDLNRLKKMAGPTVEFLGFVDHEALSNLFAGADAFLFPPLEDAGIAPLEALAAGVPVIAYGAGGALDTVIEGKTGVRFAEQTVPSILAAIDQFRIDDFDSKTLQNFARDFSETRFRERFLEIVEQELENHKKRMDNAGRIG